MYKLVLNVGDSVRNIKKASSRYLFRGIVTFVGENLYHVEYSNGDKQYYHKKTAHNFLEKTVESLNDKVCNAYISIAKSVTGGTRTTLKKERRNVITGKTQSEMVKQCGTALGVTEFNTRALGKSTGQAMVKIGEAMMHPNVPVRIVDVDHAITEHGVPRHVANKNFVSAINHIIEKQGLLGFLVNKDHLVYCPIVTEETYVNI